MRVTPKISDSPAPTRNSEEAPARPLRSWTTRPEKSMGCVRSIGRAQLLHLFVARQELRAVEIAVVDHHALATFVAGLADERAHRRLMVFGAIDELAERRLDLQAGEGRDELL